MGGGYHLVNDNKLGYLPSLTLGPKFVLYFPNVQWLVSSDKNFALCTIPPHFYASERGGHIWKMYNHDKINLGERKASEIFSSILVHSDKDDVRIMKFIMALLVQLVLCTSSCKPLMFCSATTSDSPLKTSHLWCLAYTHISVSFGYDLWLLLSGIMHQSHESYLFLVTTTIFIAVSTPTAPWPSPPQPLPSLAACHKAKA